jgi:universal stress protein E
MNTVTSIIIGIDFSAGCAAALREAIRIAQWNRASVRAVHVIDALVAAELEQAMSGFQENVRASLIADVQQAWTAFASPIEGASDVSLDVRIDSRIRGILASAREAKADLLVIGAYGTRDPDVGLGTAATACVRHAMAPVLVVRDSQPGPFKKIVACIDFSPTSLLALDQAARVAAQDGASLHVLHVFDAPWHQLHYRAPTPEADPHFQQQYREGLERRLHAFAGELGRAIDYLKPTFALSDYQGHRSGIVEYATQVGVDLIVLGTRGRTNLRDVLLGSTAEKVLRDTKCSVLAVKPEGFSHPLATGEGQPQTQMRANF